MYQLAETIDHIRRAKDDTERRLKEIGMTAERMALVKWLNASIAEAQLAVENCDIPMLIYRLQGNIQAMRNVLSILDILHGQNTEDETDE